MVSTRAEVAFPPAVVGQSIACTLWETCDLTRVIVVLASLVQQTLHSFGIAYVFHKMHNNLFLTTCALLDQLPGFSDSTVCKQPPNDNEINTRENS